jgi:hypothetical protein
MGYYLAPSLDQLRDEINARWPNRDRTSDGWIGDAAHSATTSDHNPNSRGSVNAMDIDEDGVDMAAIFAAVKQHPSSRYWIYEGKLYHRLRGWKPETYYGDNKHTKHGHLSIDQTAAAEQDTRSWGLNTTTGGIMLPKYGDKGPEVRYWQRVLIAAGESLPKYGADGSYGGEMKAAVLSWYLKHGGDPKKFDGGAVTDWTAFTLQQTVFRGAPGPAGKDGRDGKDGVVQLPMDVKITGTITQ